MMFHTSLIFVLGPKLIFAWYTIDINLILILMFFFVLEKMTFGSYLAIVSTPVLLGWPLVEMSWNPIGYNIFLYNWIFWIQVKKGKEFH
jgi:hypothetical protein